MTKQPVSILRDTDGKAVGVMVETLDERFALELNHLDNGKEYTWNGAMGRLNELGKEGFTKKQGLLIAAYSDEINATLREAGGDELDYEWAVGECNGRYAWLYYPTRGALINNRKYDSSQVRALLASEVIESLAGPRRLSGAVDENLEGEK